MRLSENPPRPAISYFRPWSVFKSHYQVQSPSLLEYPLGSRHSTKHFLYPGPHKADGGTDTHLLPRKTWKLREVKRLAQGHTARICLSRALNLLRLLDSRASALTMPAILFLNK